MAYRILVDEITSPRVANLLREVVQESVHVTEALDAGASDREIATFASEGQYVVLTHDDDFLLPEFTEEVSVLYYSDDTIDTDEIVGRVETMVEYAPDPGDLPPVTNLGGWDCPRCPGHGDPVHEPLNRSPPAFEPCHSIPRPLTRPRPSCSGS